MKICIKLLIVFSVKPTNIDKQVSISTVQADFGYANVKAQNANITGSPNSKGVYQCELTYRGPTNNTISSTFTVSSALKALSYDNLIKFLILIAIAIAYCNH